MPQYYRVMLGKGGSHTDECRSGNFIGTGFGVHTDLADALSGDWKRFRDLVRDIYLQGNPAKSKISAGLACGAIWTVSKALMQEDVVLCPTGEGRYLVSKISGSYFYRAGEILQHRRPVIWTGQTIARADMSNSLKNSTGSIGTVSDVSEFGSEIESLLADQTPVPQVAVSPSHPTVFSLEKHLEDFLVENWSKTDLGDKFEIYSDGDQTGVQFLADTGPIDILAISRDKKQLLVIELKRGKASDAVVGQTLRYMGFVQHELADPGQQVIGMIIALDDDQKLRRALSMVPNITFRRYEVGFRLL